MSYKSIHGGGSRADACLTVPFLYGSNVVRAHIARWSEDAPEHSGCIVYSMDGMSLNFPLAAELC